MTIFDGLGPQNEGPSQVRNPLIQSVNEAIRVLTKGQHENATFEITPAPDREKSWRIRWTSPEVLGEAYEITIDEGRGWSVPLLKHTLDGEIVERYTAEYELTDEGIWLPVRGARTFWQKDELGKRTEARHAFVMRERKINDPEFDESVFELKFPPGMYFVDTRFNTQYRVGAEREFEEDVIRLTGPNSTAC